jgi:hypothetical protein
METAICVLKSFGELASKVGRWGWTQSVQGAVATWSLFTTTPATSHRFLTESLNPLSKCLDHPYHYE